MTPDYIELPTAIFLIVVLWSIVFVLFFPRQIRDKIDDFFAMRRHKRRERNRKRAIDAAVKRFGDEDARINEVFYKNLARR